MLIEAQYKLLKKICPGEPSGMDGSAYAGKSKMRVLLGNRFMDQLRGKRVIDFGCADGFETLEIARSGAARVIGIDMREHMLAKGRDLARQAGFEDKCEFATATAEKADYVITIDAFEHFDDPPAILEVMYDLLVPGGSVLVSFGATWYHPLGGHLFSVFPWSHLIFSEKALLRWREDIRDDRPTKFSEIEGGLNQMTIARFERIVRESKFEMADFELSPIRQFKPIHNRLTREFTTSVIRCKLLKRA